MRESEMFVLVGGHRYPVRESAGLLKVDMNGYYGWTSIWATDLQMMEQRIKRVRSGGQ